MNGGWDDITKAELTELAKELTDRMIADKYGVTVGQVRYKRKKYGITMYDLACQAALQEGIVGRRNIKESAAKDWLLDRKHIDPLAKALTQYAFRSGPVENMHAEGRITDEDMKMLNQFMVNRLAGLLQKALDGAWEEIADVLDRYITFSRGWDSAIPDMTEFKEKF